MRNIKQIVTDARCGTGEFKMTSLEVVRMLRGNNPGVDGRTIEDALEHSMNGGSFMFGRPVVISL